MLNDLRRNPIFKERVECRVEGAVRGKDCRDSARCIEPPLSRPAHREMDPRALPRRAARDRGASRRVRDHRKAGDRNVDPGALLQPADGRESPSGVFNLGGGLHDRGPEADYACDGRGRGDLLRRRAKSDATAHAPGQIISGSGGAD